MPDRAEEPKIERLVTSTVVRKKKPVGRLARELFLSGDFKTAAQYAFADKVVPGIRQLVFDTGSEILSGVLFGRSGPKSRPGHTPDPRGLVNYNRMSRPEQSRFVIGGVESVPFAQARQQLPSHRLARSSQSMHQYVITSRDEADSVLEALHDILEKYQVVTVRDLNEMLGIRSSHVDQTWGWTSLKGSRIDQIRDGWLLNLPSPDPV
jgi:hypothetical protein